MSRRQTSRARFVPSPLLTSKTPVWRSKFIVAGLALAFLGLTARAVYVQVLDNSFFQKQGQVRFERTLTLPASRGRIYDRNGLLLASSVVAPSIWAIPDDVTAGATPTQLVQLARLLDMPLAQLKQALDSHEEKSFVWIKRQVDEPVAAQIAALKIPGIYQRKEYKREYPEGEAVAQVVGFTGVDGRGQEGAELAFDQQLSGKDGSRHVIKDRFGHVVDVVGDEVPPVDGPDLYLSIDSKIQFFAYQKVRDAVVTHKAKSGSVVVIDTRTGEVLAMANYPSYDPNNRKDLSGAQLRNIALTDTFEPGSTMKPITVGTALELGRVTPLTKIDTRPGRYQIGGFTIHDDADYGVLTVQGVIQKSSNIGALKIAQRLKPQELGNVYNLLGYGRRPDLDFPGAATGFVRPWKHWRPVEQATMAYGYGLSASLFQMVHSYTAFAHDGQVIRATLLKNASSASVQGARVFSPQTAAQIRTMLHMVVEPGGTATRAQTAGYTVGGKTGTAHKQVGRGYANNKYRAWFTGIAPIDGTRIAVGVMIDEPSDGQYFGGLVAAPVFSDVVQQTLRVLGVPPDMTVKPQIVDDANVE
ncbi:MAG: penicillin-binding protein 2 [Burkholderiaceae bacterium]|jgi:cell division protein FtsI (penicillin-binding protein 3)|nr:penicillin-binding protein 2 [Burkholderiaceae bacterium]